MCTVKDGHRRLVFNYIADQENCTDRHCFICLKKSLIFICYSRYKCNINTNVLKCYKVTFLKALLIDTSYIKIGCD